VCSTRWSASASASGRPRPRNERGDLALLRILDLRSAHGSDVTPVGVTVVSALAEGADRVVVQEVSRLPPAPQPAALARNGRYLVYRKLHQNVALFRRFLAERSRAYPGGEEKLAAALMGRWRDGTPIERSPDGPDPSLSADLHRINDFGFSQDHQGFRCPVGAHIRRANPRDALGFRHKMVHRHRLIRRGMPYGNPLPPGSDDDGSDRGLIFVSVGASIMRQFEFVQSQWMNDGNIFNLGADKDAFVGDNDGTGKMTVQGRPPWFVAAVPRLVTTKGGDYFFLPGISALHHISGD
jgi:Dyp-type peroxidase family